MGWMRRRQARCGYRPGGCEGMPARQHRTALILRNCALASKLLSRVYSFARPFVDIALVLIPCAKLLLLRRRSAAGSIRIYRVSPMNRTNEMSRMLRKPFEHASRIRARVFRDCITKQVNLRCSNCGEARHPWDKRTCKSPGAGKWMLPLIFFMSLRKMEVLFCFPKLHADSQWPSTCCRGSPQGHRVKSLIRPDRNHHTGGNCSLHLPVSAPVPEDWGRDPSAGMLRLRQVFAPHSMRKKHIRRERIQAWIEVGINPSSARHRLRINY